jgi:hypothetical protein
MNKYATACLAAAFAAFATPASAGIIIEEIIVQRSIWVQLMGLLGF